MGNGRIKTCPLCGKPGYTHHVCTTKKPKSCPYCGHELHKRDTTALGGDETFDWCPDCERVIEECERVDV